MQRIIVLMAILLLGSSVNAQENVPDFSDLEAIINQQLEAQNTNGFAISLVQDGEVIYAQGFGVRDKETNDPVTADTIFRIGSTTKPLTTIGLLMLVEEGLIDLDESVATYVPEFTINDDITVRHLLSHTAGLKDRAIPYGPTHPEALAEFVASFDETASFSEPGDVFSYSNPGFNVAGHVIEAVSGQWYADYMAEAVFAQLDMQHSTLYPTVAMTYPLAQGYQQGQLVRPNPDNVEEYPAGFIFSSVTDIARLMTFILQDGTLDDETILDEALVLEMKTPQTARISSNNGEGYGLGLFISNYRGTDLIGHDGGINGYGSYMNTVPEYGLGISMLYNNDAFDATPIFDAVLDLLTDLPPEAQNEFDADTVVLEDYVGSYQFASFTGEDDLTIKVELTDGGDLAAQASGQPTLTLNPVAENRFEVLYLQQQIGITFDFLKDDQGNVVYLSLGARVARRTE